MARMRWAPNLVSGVLASSGKACRVWQDQANDLLEDIPALFPLVSAGDFSVSAVVYCMAVGAATGTALGTFLGFLVGLCLALWTIGLSILVCTVGGAVAGAAIGVAAGGAVGALRYLRHVVLCAERSLLYHPRRYEQRDVLLGPRKIAGRQYELERLDYATGFEGAEAQSGLLLWPRTGTSELWVLFGGNAMVAADWLPLCDRLLSASTQTGGSQPAFLLFDYPGYGWNSGDPGPEVVLEASLAAIGAAEPRLGKPGLEVHFFGHSLGAAAAAQAAASLGTSAPGRLVLSAPFLSIPHMAVHLVCSVLMSPGMEEGLFGPVFIVLLRALLAFLSFTVPHCWSNVVSVKKATVAGWQVGIIHGARDELVPVTMGRELHCLSSRLHANSRVPAPTFIEVPMAGHAEVLLHGSPDCAQLMGFVERAKPPLDSIG